MNCLSRGNLHASCCIFLVNKLVRQQSFAFASFLRSSENEAHPLLIANEVIDVYCYMTMATISNGECGDGGWTMKIDGNQVKLKMNK